jgi:serine/threonine-protein kinase
MTRFGSYELLSELGRGGMGVVYRAQHTVLGTPAVVKLLLPELTQEPQITERFVREAKAAAALQHPHIVEVKDCGQSATGQWYIALEYLEGVPLSRWITQPVPPSDGVPSVRRGVHRRLETGPVPPAQAVAILSQAANALHAAHEQSIVHRDVKPDNIFLVDRSGNDLFVVLLDFGVAKLAEEQRPLTQTGIGIGTPAYMAPEQLRNAKDVDRRADVYALGVVLYELLTGGHLPWGHNTEAVEIYRLQLSVAPPDPRAIVPSISPALVEVIARAMAADRAQRWPDAAVFAQALAEAVPPSGVTPAGPEILRAYAPELLRVASGNTTVGHRISSSVTAAVSNATPVPWSPPGAPAPGVTPALRPLPGGAGTAAWSPPPRGALTTLGGAAAQSAPHLVPPARSRGRLIAAIGMGAVAAAIGLTVALTRGAADRAVHPGSVAESDAGDSAAAHVSTTIRTSPPGAAVFVDDEPRGASPVTLELPSRYAVTIRAELDGYLPTELRHSVGAHPDTVTVTLVPAIDAAADVDAASISASPASRTPPAKTSPSSGRDHKPLPPTDAGVTSSPRPFDPDGVGGE